jgi:hypothetical protein
MRPINGVDERDLDNIEIYDILDLSGGAALGFGAGR